MASPYSGSGRIQKRDRKTTAATRYHTRFFRDSYGNQVQVGLDGGRLRQSWANGFNESLGFSFRVTDGERMLIPRVKIVKTRPRKALRKPSETASSRTVQYDLEFGMAGATDLEVGNILVDSVLEEREAQRQGLTRQEPGRPEFRDFASELAREAVSLIAQLPKAERLAQLQAMGTGSLEHLTKRIGSNLQIGMENDVPTVRIERSTLDGKFTQSVEVSAEQGIEIVHDPKRQSLRFRLKKGRPGTHLTLHVRSETNGSPAQRPMRRQEVFTDAFLHEINQMTDATEKRLHEAMLRSAELLITDDKLLAGLPNYGTYFGRDTIMTSILLEPVLQPSMLEVAIGSVARRMSTTGLVSHEETLGMAAYRSNLGRYNALLRSYLKNPNQKFLARDARQIASALFTHHEDYRMVDDDFLFPVLVAKYLERRDISEADKAAFLNGGNFSQILRNLKFIVDRTAGYAERERSVGDVTGLIEFPLGPQGREARSWRDSEVGYAGGRFPMDVNAIWVPQALRAAQTIGHYLTAVESSPADEAALAKQLKSTVATPDFDLRIQRWEQAEKHFRVRLTKKQMVAKIAASQKRATPVGSSANSLLAKDASFWAVSLDEQGNPIPVMNSDIGSLLIGRDLSREIAMGTLDEKSALEIMEPLSREYPYGLLIPNVGVVAANDTFAGSEVAEAFAKDGYHGPKAVWGREINIAQLGLAKQLQSALTERGELRPGISKLYVETIWKNLQAIHTAARTANRPNSELWSYQIVDGRPVAVRYQAPTEAAADAQLWNLAWLSAEQSFRKVESLMARFLAR